ncbi:MAG TPA: AI-2E family transporter [Acidimicrobiia bacterium]|nr:AI-2E family transporter [Acidimicrobiia bacterium]
MVIGVVIVVRILAVLQNTLVIVAAAFVISLGLQPTIRFLEERGMRRGTAMALIILGGLVVAAGAALAVIPLIVRQAAQAFDRLPELWAELQARSDVIGDLADRFDLNQGIGEGANPIAIASAVLVGVFNTVTLLLLTPYFAVSFPSLKSGLFRLIKREHREDYIFVVNRAVDLTSNYIVGNLIISLMAGVVSFIGFWLIGLPYPLALATWVALTDLIPAIGALIGMVPVLLIAAQTSGQTFAWALLLMVAYQQFENYVIAPRVMRQAVDLNPAVVIISLLVGGSLAGLVGAVLALPVAALTKVLVTEFLVRARVDIVRAAEPEPGPRRRRSRGRIGSRPLP